MIIEITEIGADQLNIWIYVVAIVIRRIVGLGLIFWFHVQIFLN